MGADLPALPIVIPAKAGIHSPVRWGKEPTHQRQWIPAFAGMTAVGDVLPAPHPLPFIPIPAPAGTAN